MGITRNIRENVSMSDEETPTGEVAQAPENDVIADPSTAPEVEAKPEGEVEASEAEKKEEPPKKNGFQNRINQLTNKHRESQRDSQQRNEELEARIKVLEAGPKSEKTTTVPKEDDYENYSEFQVAHTEYVTEKATDAAVKRMTVANQARDDKDVQDRKQADLQIRRKAFDKRLEDKRGQFEDFEDVAYSNQFLDQDLAEQLLDMEPEVAYFLGSNLDESERMLGLTPVQRARELTKLEYKLTLSSGNKVSNAPDPITPLGGAEKLEVDPSTLSQDEWVEMRNRQIFRRDYPHLELPDK